MLRLPLAVDDNNDMLCPACGDNHVHILSASSMPHAENETWRGAETAGSASLTFQGECGHVWSINTQFSKGQTSLEIYIHPEARK